MSRRSRSKREPMLPERQPGQGFGRGNPLRDESMVTVGKLLILAASPDEYDGLSERVYSDFKLGVPGVFFAWEQISKIDNRSNLSLPPGFTKHFYSEVLPDLEIIRNDPEKRAEFRAAIEAIINNPRELKRLYDDGGTTYSDVATIIAGTNRKGKFYAEIPVLPEAIAAILPRVPVPGSGLEEVGHGSR